MPDNNNNGMEDQVSVPHNRGYRVDKGIIVDAPVEEVYRFWRNFENLPRFMDHLKEVRVLDNRRSHWVAKAPLGTKVEWDAEIINEIPNQVIGWRSTEGSQVANAGSVRFQEAQNNSTMVTVQMKYDPPAGAIGAAVAKLFGENPDKQIEEDLHRLRELFARR